MNQIEKTNIFKCSRKFKNSIKDIYDNEYFLHDFFNCFEKESNEYVNRETVKNKKKKFKDLEKMFLGYAEWISKSEKIKKGTDHDKELGLVNQFICMWIT